MKRYFNLLFWTGISIIFLLGFGISSGNFSYTFYFVSFYIPIVIVTSIIFNNILVPRYLLKRKFGKFIFYTISLIVISLDLELTLVFISLLLLSIYDYEKLDLILDNYKLMPVIMYLVVILKGFIDVLLIQFNQTGNGANSSEKDHFIVRADRQNRKILISSVSYIESMSDYVRIFLIDGSCVITREKISALEIRLPNNFLRIHRSYLVNLNNMESYTREFILFSGRELPISRTYKKEVISRLANLA